MKLVEQLKSELALEISSMLDGASLEDAGATIGIHPTRMLRLRNGKLKTFSLRSLVGWIELLGYDLRVFADAQEWACGH